MKKIVFMLIFCLLCSELYAETEFPYIGICSGNSVRIREDPGNEGKIIGRADFGNVFVVLDEIFIDGQKWYEIDNPSSIGTAFIYGKYLQPEYTTKESINTASYKMSVEIQLNFGITEEKALALNEYPKNISNRGKREILKYEGYELTYYEGLLSKVSVFESGKSFGEIRVGDSQKKLVENLGNELKEINAEEWYCLTDSGEKISFEFDGSKEIEAKTKIIKMTWENQNLF